MWVRVRRETKAIGFYEKYEQNRQYTYMVTLRRVRAAMVAM
jgi:hypothetical protein